MSTELTVAPVPVLLTNPEALAGVRTDKRRPRRQMTFRTINLTAASPVQVLLGADPARLYALVQAGGNSVVLTTSQGEAQDPNNVVANIPNPEGFVLTAGNTVPVKLEGVQPVYASANAFPSQVTMIVVHELAD